MDESLKREELLRRRKELAVALRECGRRERAERDRFKQMYRAIRRVDEELNAARARGASREVERLEARSRELDRQRKGDRRGTMLEEFNRIHAELYQVELELSTLDAKARKDHERRARESRVTE